MRESKNKNQRDTSIFGILSENLEEQSEHMGSMSSRNSSQFNEVPIEAEFLDTSM